MSFGISNTPDLLWCIPFRNAPSRIPDGRSRRGKAPPASRFCSSSSGVSVREIRFLPASLLKISRLYALRILPSIVKSLHRGVSFVRWAPALLNTAKRLYKLLFIPVFLGFKKRSSRKNSCLSKAAARITRTMTEMTVTAASRIFAKREGPAAASPNSGGIKLPAGMDSTGSFTASGRKWARNRRMSSGQTESHGSASLRGVRRTPP